MELSQELQMAASLWLQTEALTHMHTQITEPEWLVGKCTPTANAYVHTQGHKPPKKK